MPRHLLSGRAGRRFIEALESRTLLNGGQLDPSFSSDGMTTAKFESDLQNSEVAIEGNKTLVVGTVGLTNEIAMARFNFDGSLDKTFNRVGILQTHPDGDSSTENSANAVAIDGQGRIVVVGSNGSDMLVLRFNSDGTLDTSFDHDGIVTIDFPGLENATIGYSVAIQENGKIVVAGYNSGLQISGDQAGIAVARLNTNGSLDTTFGDGFTAGGNVIRTGTTQINFGFQAEALAIALDTTQSGTNPRIVLGGEFATGSNNTVEKMVVMRLLSNGSLDNSFDQDGKVALSLPGDNVNVVTALAVQSGGKVVVTGFAGPHVGQSEVFAAFRLNSNGSIDPSFGDQGDGTETVNFGGDAQASSLVVGLNGRLFLGGSVGGKIAVAALTSNGDLDSSFGSGGKVTTTVSGGITGDDALGGERAVGIGYLGDRVVVASPKYTTATTTVVRYLDINPAVSLVQGISTGSEQGSKPATFVVELNQTLPFDTIVNFSVGGTATEPNLISNRLHTADYSLSGLTIPLLGAVGQPIPPPFVDIPAGQFLVVVTLTPIDDSTAEPTETATFSTLSSTFYTIGSPSSRTLSILDNDGTASTSLTTTADAYVRDGTDAATNFGSATDLEVKDGGTGFDRITYVKFDLSSVSSIGNAQLQMFGGLSDTQNASINTSLFTVADTSWTESGIHSNNAPALSASPLLTATITGNTAKTYSFDVTSYLQAQKAAGHNIVSFAFKDSATSSSFVKFNSKEAGSNPPLLVIAPPSVGTFKVSSPHTTPAGQTTDVAVTWQVPSGNWQQLHTIDLRLSEDVGSLIDIQWNQENETLALLDPKTGKFGPPQALGSNTTLSNSLLDVLLKTSSKLSTGPTSPLVTVTFSLQFKNAAKGHHFSVEVAARNDTGVMTKFGLGKSITVT